MRGYWLSGSGVWKFNRHYQAKKLGLKIYRYIYGTLKQEQQTKYTYGTLKQEQAEKYIYGRLIEDETGTV